VEINFYFLLFSLFFPRLILVLFIFLYPNLYPANTVPNWADVLLGLLFPRLLILIYIYQNMGYENIWFVAHLIAAVIAYTGGSHQTVRRRRRRRPYEDCSGAVFLVRVDCSGIEFLPISLLSLLLELADN
jgi:hypothetical protein